MKSATALAMAILAIAPTGRAQNLDYSPQGMVIVAGAQVYSLDVAAPIEAPDSNTNSPAATTAGTFAYPNPSTHGKTTIHVSHSGLEGAEVRIFDAARRLVHRASLAAITRQGQRAFEYNWDHRGVAAGVYVYTVKATIAGRVLWAKGGKIAVVR